MSVLIKGLKMPMPERCWDCRFMESQTGRCYADGSVRGMAQGYKRPADCPLFPIPDHGRLVDADEMERMFLKATGISISFNGVPTVIPAEREGL